ncbi:MAG TPA: hypothetical protein VNW97_00100 [Candidatus Saccharimonadales bacterium]|jgi:hypothetical protein|nr:hypothetical protein [Candidatus Saccharimonadales bacterium]
MKQMRWIFQFACGSCQHRRMSRVFTINKRTYQVCCECGREFDYSWARMHAVEITPAAHADAPLTLAGRGGSLVIDPLAL